MPAFRPIRSTSLVCQLVPLAVLFAVVALFVDSAGAAGAVAPITATDSSADAPLSGSGEAGRVCVSTDAAGGCTLRAAVQLADLVSLEAGQGVTVDVPAATFTDSLGTLTIAAGARVALSGSGASASILDGDHAGSVLTVERGAGLTTRDLTLRDGLGAQGGAIDVAKAASLIVQRSALESNSAGEDGGAIYFNGAIPSARISRSPFSSQLSESSVPLESLTISQSTIAHNTAGDAGGALYYRRTRQGESLDAGKSSIVNTTIANNESQSSGGIFVEASVLQLVDDTLLNNTSTSPETHDGNLLAAGTRAKRGEILLHATIVAQTTRVKPECEGNIQSDGYNVDYPSADAPEECGLSAGQHDLIGIDPLLDPRGLQPNGGPTDTIALLSSPLPSPAIGAVPSDACGRTPLIGEPSTFEPIASDQRGSPRPGVPGSGCDIGAFEYSPPTPHPSCAPSSSRDPGGSTQNALSPGPTTPSASGPGAGVNGCASDLAPPATDQPAGVVTVATTPAPAAFARSCVSRRDFAIHVQSTAPLTHISVRVYVHERLLRTLKDGSPTIAMNLRGLPRGTVVVKISATTRDGERLTGMRRYHTCMERLPAHKHLRL